VLFLPAGFCVKGDEVPGRASRAAQLVSMGSSQTELDRRVPSSCGRATSVSAVHRPISPILNIMQNSWQPAQLSESSSACNEERLPCSSGACHARTCMAFQWTLSGPALMRRWRSNEGQREPPTPRKDCCSHSSLSPFSSASRDAPACEPAALSVAAGAGGIATAASEAGSKGDCGACSSAISSDNQSKCCLRSTLPY